jgi:hypothetical protein
VEAGAGLRHPSLWSGFCRIWSCHCSLPALNNGPISQKVQIRNQDILGWQESKWRWLESTIAV